MTVIKSGRYLCDYQYLALDKSVVLVFEKSLVQKKYQNKLTALLKIFECYCYITDQKINYTSLSENSFIEITVKGFLGALHSDELIKVGYNTRMEYAKLFVDSLSWIKEESVSAMGILLWQRDLPRDCIKNWEDIKYKINDDAVEYWSGWEVYSRKGIRSFFKFSYIYCTHGKSFTLRLYNAVRNYYNKEAVINSTLLNSLAMYLASSNEEWPASAFQDPVEINKFFLELMRNFFTDANDKSLDMEGQKKDWNMLLGVVNTALIKPGVWAKPVEGLPRINLSKKPGVKKKISVNNNKEKVVSQNLITDIPLEVSDDQAIEILFRNIKEDIRVIRNWAEAQAESLIFRCRRRKRLSLSGKIIYGGMFKKHSEKIGLKDLCATFEKDGFSCDQAYLRTRFGGCSSPMGGNYSGHAYVARELGLPVANSLFPFQILLVLEHPEITSSFIRDLELYDKKGNISGFQEIDGYSFLVGYKDRSKKINSEKKITLNNRSASYVKNIIEITSPLRDFLKVKGESGWRYLFLTCGRAFGKPGKANIPRWTIDNFVENDVMFRRLVDEFEPHTFIQGVDLGMFLSRVTLGTVRNSRAVELYLKTGSSEEMSKALGHSKYSVNLLAHYLPEPLLGFFQSRWIRIFQKAFICKAMEGSPYLLEASSFKSMKELSLFLGEHALENIPNPKENVVYENSVENFMYIRVNTEILATLKSVEKAVELSSKPEKISGNARYWSELSRLITKQILSEQDPDLCYYLERAKEKVMASAMEELIYETP